DAPLPLSFAQARLWFLDRMEPGSPAYHMPYAMRLRGALDVGALADALTALVARHESLRTRFADAGGEPVQVIDPPFDLPLPVVAVEGADDAAREAEALRLAAREAARPFDLARGPLFRASLLRLGAEDHVLLATAHHVVADGWSMDVVVRELSALYDGFRRGAPPALPGLPVQYADYAVWQRERLTGHALDRQLDWWKARLDGAPPLLEIPTDHPRAAEPSPRAATHDFALSETATRALRELGRREGATLFMVLLAGWQALLARYAGTSDVVVGTPVSGRGRVELEGLVGFFVNTLALRTGLAGDPAFTALLARVRDTTLGAWQHQDLPFDRLVEALGVERSLAHTPVFQAMFSLERTGRGGSLALGEAAAEWFGGWGEGAKFDLDLTLMERETRITGVLRYRAALFDPATIERMAARFTALLEDAAADASRPFSELGTMDEAERARVLAAAAVAAAPYPEATVHDLFSAQAAATPAATALLFGGARITYAAVEARANRLAHHLRRRGVGTESRVALCLERSPDLYVAMLGILKAGAAFVPLDPSYPPERLAAMVADAGARVLVTTTRLSAELPVAFPDVVRMDKGGAGDGEPETPPPPAGAPDALAYVVFTSGSTGTPKGVAVPHRAVVRLVRETTYAAFGPGETVLQLAPVSFDASTFEIWGALLNGGALAVFPPGVPTLDALARFVRDRGVTTLWLTAGLFHPMVDADPAAFRGVRQLVAGGDVLSPDHVRRVLEACPGLVVVNGYGPTENTTFTACARIAAPAEAEGAVPIGHPVAHTTAYVVDAALRPVPDGIPGELVTGGAGLARGYVGRPALTAERFVPSPFGPAGARLYRTGDRVRRRLDGRLEFLGRADAQVKIRGFRVEPGEVEAALLAHPGVREAVVTVHEDAAGDRRLVAYTVAEPGAAPSAADLRAAVAGRLPEYMLPAAFVALEALPVNANGKVDRRALPAPSWSGEEQYVAPRTPVEEVLAGIWAQVLGWSDRGGDERVGVHDDFFVLGGHSLLATQVVARVQQAFGVEFPVRTVFEAPTVAAFAERVEGALLGGLSDADLAAVEG
ncbi:MAG TPA: amino acid adenylation domain-containing protein, partial [Longimicrobium sp.]|nr:amino acid adenylation domain-containing protein [Longimicrobium sp.]